MKPIVCAGHVAILVVLLSLAQAQQSGNDSHFRDLLTEHKFRSRGMQEIFRKGSSSTQRLVDALRDHDETVNLNSQFMLRLIGDEAGIRDLHKWYDEPRESLAVVNGPVPVPLREWDYEQVERIMARPPREWREDALNYLYALTIDRSPRALRMLSEMLNSAEKETNTTAFHVAANLRQWQSQVDPCGHVEPQRFVKTNLFYLAPEERMSATVKVLAYAGQRHLVLLAVTQTFGNTFLVVLKNKEGCWRYQSVALYSTNN